jgi:hypothetical protein
VPINFPAVVWNHFMVAPRIDFSIYFTANRAAEAKATLPFCL